jgi:anti-sigma factor RsiW
MPACDQVKLLLGPFDDGELEPHEMEEVALHVVTCAECKAALEDYRSLGVALRDCVVQPPAAGFTEAVMERIAEIRPPLHVRLRRRLDGFAESLSGGLALTAAGAFAALATVWLVSPYTSQLFHHRAASSPVQAELAPNHSEIAGLQGESAKPVSGPGGPNLSGGSQTGVRNGPEPENGPSMITLLNDNDPATTVIWVPDQP